MVTLATIKQKQVVVYGTGVNAVKCVHFLEENNVKIEYVIDGRTGIGRFKDYQVFQPEKQFLDGKYIVVASSFDTYPAIRERLKEYVEFHDFIYYHWINKKMVFLHGNCHMDIIEEFLNSSSKFCEEYAIYPTPRICTKTHVMNSTLANMDVWIHEDIQTNNAFGYEYSDEYIKKYLSPCIQEIVMPHLYGLGAGFFPHAKEENERNVSLLNGEYENGMFPIRDDIIEHCLQLHKSVDKICEYVNEDDIIPKEYIESNFKEYLDKIRQREQSWDIKILDFILENYKTDKLFYDKGHPTNLILKKICEGILEILQIEDIISCIQCLDYHEVPIYSWVRKILGMEWTEQNIRVSDSAIKATDRMDIQEYIREYVWWCYPELG